MTREEIVAHCDRGRKLAALPSIRQVAREMTAEERVEMELLIVEIDREVARILAERG